MGHSWSVKKVFEIFRGDRSLLLVLGLTFLARLDSIMLQSNNPLLAREFYHAGLLQVALTSTVYAVATLLVRYLVSVRLTPAQIPKAMVAGFFLLGVSLGFSSVARNLPVFLGLIALSGVGTALIMPLLLSLVGLISEANRRDVNLSYYSLMLSLSLVIGPGIGGAVVRREGLSFLYLVLAVAALLAVVFLIGGMEGLKRRVAQYHQPGGARNFRLGPSLRALGRNRPFVDTFLGMIIFSLAFSASLVYAGIYAKEHFGLSLFGVQMMLLGFFGVSFLFRILLTRRMHTHPIEDKDVAFRRQILLSGLGLLAMGLATDRFIFLTGFFFLGIPHALLFPMGTMRVATAVKGSGELVAANTIFQSAFDVAGIFGPLLLAPLARSEGIGAALVWLALVFPLTFWWLRRKDTFATSEEREKGRRNAS